MKLELEAIKNILGESWRWRTVTTETSITNTMQKIEKKILDIEDTVE